MSRFESGWVKLAREDVTGVIGKRGIETLGLWARLLGFASRYEVKVQGGFLFPAGSVVTSLADLAGTKDERVLSKVRRDLNFLESIGRIQQKNISGGRVISILNWETDMVENSEKEGKIRQTCAGAPTKSEEKSDKAGCISTSEDSLENNQTFSAATENCERGDNESTEIRTLNGEENKKKKEERVISISSKAPSNEEKSQNQNSFSWEKKVESEVQAGATKGAPTPQDCAAPPAHVGPADLLRVWNENRGTLPEAKALTASRRKSAQSRLREQPELEYWVGVVKSIAASSFCKGENQRSWKASIDFLLRPDTHVKVTEGAYSKTNQNPKLKVKTVEEIYSR
jgi:hypothetical protein